MCEGYVQSQGGSRLRLFEVDVWTNIQTIAGSTSCYATDFSPDGNQVVFGMGWYAADGATAKIMKSQAEPSSIRFPKVAQEDAHRQTTTSADRTTVFHGRLMASTSPKHLAETTKVSTSGRATLTLITMVGTPPIKAMVKSTNSRMMVHNGKILMEMDMVTTLRLL